MSLSCGIVGLPNVGKSTLFSTLTKSMVESQNYPFTTIDPNIGIVDVPDERLYEIAKIISPERIFHSTVQFVDVAGLVRGAADGEGLGNQFLSHIRDVDAIIQVVRIFNDDNIIHVHGKIDPVDDFEVITTELILRDLDILSKQKSKLEKNSKASKEALSELPFLEQCIAHLSKGFMLNTLVNTAEELPSFLRDTRPLTLKPMVVAANMDESSIGNPEKNSMYIELQTFLKERNIRLIPFCAKLELDLLDLSDEEKQELIELYSIKESGLSLLIKAGYSLLNYMSYFTAGVKEVRAWTIKNGWKAPAAAGVIHSDFEKGFIRAEVIHYDDFIQCGGEKGAREQGKVQVEGKEYVVQDGDVMNFRFNN